MTISPATGALGAALLVGTIVGAMLGHAHEASRSAVGDHIFAFTGTGGCTKQAAVCSIVRVVDADAISPDLHDKDLTAFPAGTRTVFESTLPILGLGWSPEGRRLAYLAARFHYETPSTRRLDQADLWTVGVSGDSPRLIQTDVVDHSWFERFASYEIRWPADGAIVVTPSEIDLRREPVGNGFQGEESTSPDGTLLLYIESGIDSNWICVRDPATSADDGRARCFGDDYFGSPVWRPAR